MSPLCAIRFVLRNIGRLPPWISGHDYHEQQMERGQPYCVQILKCNACGKTSVAWSGCVRCGFTGGEISNGR